MTTITHETRQGCLILPYGASSEAKAEQFADAIEVLFSPCVSTAVLEDGGKWYVAVIEGMDEIDDPVDDERIAVAVILLASFDLTEGTGTIECIAERKSDIPPVHKALTRRARRAFRIEAKLDAILTALDGAGRKAPA